MRHNHFRSIFPLFLAFVPRVASFLPHPTKAEHAIHQGVSPIPTQGPYLMELATESSDTQDLRRLAARQNPGACAYVSGIQSASLTCSPGMACAVNVNGAAGCCLAGSFVNCLLATTCLPYPSMAACNGPCLTNPTVVKCFDPAFPYCITLAIDYKTATYYAFNCATQPGTVTALPSYTNAPRESSGVVRPVTVSPVSITISPVTATATPAQNSPGGGGSNNNNNINTNSQNQNNNININVGGQPSPGGGGSNNGGVSVKSSSGFQVRSNRYPETVTGLLVVLFILC